MYGLTQHHQKSRAELGTSHKIANLMGDPGAPTTRTFLKVMGNMTIRVGAPDAGCFAIKMFVLDSETLL